MRPLLKAGLRHLAHHRSQLVLTVLGVTLGVAVVVAMDLGVQSAREAFRISSQTIAGRATHQVAGGSAGIPDSLIALLRRRPEVQAAAPVLETFVTSPVLPGRALRLLGIDPLSEAPFRPYLGGSEATTYSQGAPGEEVPTPEEDPGPSEPTGAGPGRGAPAPVAPGTGPDTAMDGSSLLTVRGGVILSRGTASAAGVELGDILPIRHGIESRDLRVVGVLDPEDERSRRGLQDVLVLDIAEAQDLLGRTGLLDRIDLRLPETDPTAASDLRSVLPSGIRLEGAGASERTMNEMIRAFNLNLTALSLLGLVFGFFLIYNTMTFSVVQRRRTLGLFRVLGTTRATVRRGILVEAGVLGLVGSLLGILVGIVLGRGLVRLVVRTINDLYFTVSVESLALPPEALVKGLLLGVGATLLAALPPAREASRVSPREALSRSSVEDRARQSVGRAGIAGTGLALLGAGVLALPGASVGMAFLGLFAIILGMALVTPIVTVAAMTWLRPVLKRTAGVLGGMAARGVVTALSRTAPAMAALVIAVSVTIGLGVMIGSFRTSVEDWLDATLRADLYVSAPSAVSARVSGEIPAPLPARIREIPGVAGVSENLVRDLGAEYPGARLMAVRLSEADASNGGFDLLESTGDAPMEAFRRGEGIFVSESFAFRYRFTPGDSLRIAGETDVLPARILAVFRDYASESGTAVMARTLYDRHWTPGGVTSLAVFLDPTAIEADIEARIRSAVPTTGAVQVRSNRALRQLSLDVFDRTFAITRVLRLLAFLVAFIGVLSALMALQLEREREFGVLRAVGLTPAQAWGLITGQTGIMGAVAGILAVPVGLVLAAVMIFVVNRRSFGWSIGMEVDPAVLVQGVLLALTGALLAGIVPSRKIARTSPSVALRGE